MKNYLLCFFVFSKMAYGMLDEKQIKIIQFTRRSELLLGSLHLAKQKIRKPLQQLGLLYADIGATMTEIQEKKGDLKQKWKTMNCKKFFCSQHSLHISLRLIRLTFKQQKLFEKIKAEKRKIKKLNA